MYGRHVSIEGSITGGLLHRTQRDGDLWTISFYSYSYRIGVPSFCYKDNLLSSFYQAFDLIRFRAKTAICTITRIATRRAVFAGNIRCVNVIKERSNVLQLILRYLGVNLKVIIILAWFENGDLLLRGNIENVLKLIINF